MNKQVEINEKIILEWFEGCNDVKVIKRELDEKEKGIQYCLCIVKT